MEPGTVTVDCINSDRCGGRVTLHFTPQAGILPSGAPGADAYVTSAEQTCTCTYSDEEREKLKERAVEQAKGGG